MSSADNKKIPTVNTPKVGYSGVTSNTPGAFEIKKLLMTNSDGVTKDLRKLADSFTITAELFSPVVTLSMTIRDNGDFIDNATDGSFKIYGQEKIEVEIDPLIAGDAIKHTFFVKEYVNYTKTLDFPNTQMFSLIAISEFAYRSSLMKICRVIDQEKTTDENIKTIFVDDLGIKEFEISGTVATKFTGIINIQAPLRAAEWLRSRCFEEKGDPFFLYSDVTRDNTVFLSSWSSLNSGAKIGEFKYRQHSKEKPGSDAHKKEERTRILHMQSNIKFDRLGAANSGAYATRLNVTDYASKGYYTLEFKTKKTNDWVPQKYKIKNRDGNQEEKIMHDIPSAKISSVQINSAINPGALANSTTGTVYPYIAINNAFMSRLNEINHEILVYGYSALNPGSKVKLEVPKSIREDVKYTLDPVVSGDFIISVASHIFSNGMYTTKLKLVKPGSVELSEDSSIPEVPSAVSADALSGSGTSSDSGTGTSTSTSTGTATPFTGTQREYFDKVYNAVLAEAKARGLANPEVIARLAASQSALETGWGKHMPAGSNNAFGIKGKGTAGTVNAKTREEYGGKSVTITDGFRAYNNFNESAADYVDFLIDNKRYKPVLAATNIDDAVRAMGASGYATASDYGAKVGSIAKKY